MDTKTAEKWEKYENIDIDYYHKLQLHIPWPTFINQDSVLVDNFNEGFKAEYGASPDKFSTLGFDVAFYYFKMLHTYGRNFVAEIENVKHKGVLNSFDFYKTGFNSGYENQSVTILKYIDYELTRVE